MSDNRRVYRTIRMAIEQLYPSRPQGNFARNLNTLAAMVAGIVQGKSCQLPTIARHAPDTAKPDSRIKHYSRWISNPDVSFEAYFLPFAQPILANLAKIRPLVFVMDGSEVGHHCITLMASVIYQKRALPVAWLVVSGSKGHLAEEIHLKLLEQLKTILPEDCQAIFLGDGEFDGIGLQAALQASGWNYVCRTAKNMQLYGEEEPFSFVDLFLRPGDCLGIPDVQFTRQAYGCVTAIGWWKKGFKEPIYLVTNFELVKEACYWYQKRFQIETFFSDEKSRGFNLQKSHVSNTQRLARLMMATCLAYLWLVYLGITAHREGWVDIIHRTDRCDWSLFRLGLCLLEHLLNEDLPIPVAFNFWEPKSVRY
jgi:hypothetical protein